MKNIPFEKIQEFTIGAQKTEVAGNTLTFHRIPDAMCPFYDSEQAIVRVQCTAGIRIRFLSDTNLFELAVKYGAAARSIFQGSLIVDNDIYPWGPETAEPEWRDRIFHSDEKRERLFDIWLPHLCKTDVISIRVDDHADFVPAPPLKLRWLALGDSIMQGMTATLPTRTHTGIISLSINAECCNMGVGGACFDKRIASALPTAKFDFIVVSYGTNDFHHSVPLEQMTDNAMSLLSQIVQKYDSPKIFLITPVTWVDHPEKNQLGISLHQYRDALAEVASSVDKIILIDGTAMIPDDSTFFVDKVHPNNRGFSVYASNFLAELHKHTNFVSDKIATGN